MKNLTVKWVEQDAEFEATSADHPMFSTSASTADEAVRELELVTFARREGADLALPSVLPANSALLRIRAPRAFERAVKRAAARRSLSVETFVLAALVRAMASEEASPSA